MNATYTMNLMHTCSHQPQGFEQPDILVNLFCMHHAESDVKNENFSNCFVSPIYCGLLLLRACNFLLLEATYSENWSLSPMISDVIAFFVG